MLYTLHTYTCLYDVYSVVFTIVMMELVYRYSPN